MSEAKQSDSTAELGKQVMRAIDEYVKRYDLRGSALRSAAADVCDGWLTRSQLQPLLNARRLRLVGRPDHDDEVCGPPWSYSWTVELTEREKRRRYPDRLLPNAELSTPQGVTRTPG